MRRGRATVTPPAAVVNRAMGWDHAQARPHFCYPPQIYADGYGHGSKWACPQPACRRVWQAQGYRVQGTYPVGSVANHNIGVERWVQIYGPKAPPEEIALYDWRDPTVVMLEWFEKKWGA